MALLLSLALLVTLVPVTSAQTAISYGQSASGSIAIGGSQLWTFSGTAGDTISISVSWTGVQWDPYVELLNSSNTVIAQNDDISYGVNLNSLISNFVLPTTGNYTILVRSYRNNSGGTYSISLSRSGTSGSASCTLSPATSVSVDGVFVYSEANAGSTLVAVLSLGSQVQVLDSNLNNGFTRVRLGNCVEGWAQLNVSGVPGGTTDNSSQPSGPTGVVVEARGNVRIRETASLNASQLGIIGWGEQASVLSEDSSGNWLQISFEGITGWVAADWFVVVSGDPNSIGTSAVPGSQTEPIVVSQENGNTTVVAPGTIIQAFGNVAIRETPSVNARRIGLAPWGAQATLLGVDDSGLWARVNYDGLEGWSAIQWWRLVSGEIAEGETPAEQPENAVVDAPVTDVPPSSGVTVIAVGNVRIRATPSVNGDRLGFIGWGDVADALARNENGSWLLINANGVIGWVARDWLEVETGNPAELPVR